MLRAKYLDWCSAQVADELFALTPDEIFELSQRAAEADPGVAGHSLFSSVDGAEPLSYRRLVAAVTEVLTAQMRLPEYDEWLVLYRANPAAVEERLLGLWRERSEKTERA